MKTSVEDLGPGARIEYYYRMAAEALCLSKRAQDLEQAANLLDIAAHWTALAKGVDRREQHRLDMPASDLRSASG